ncbi:hypothetical protein ACJ72_02008 [Emergomyces africanus]|uniref:J domain-containing protein n=1 Tax=Emergomyces africanus TaxID=1955775 RepID=A0A1B7P3L6_9EURO|nr:hypothetical protein ACJ72_02008 [Emergomyces africanus]
MDYYKILEVDPTATEHQIRFAYKRAALKSHPDRVPTTSPDRPAREETFKKVNEAYYVLSDPSRRRQYDHERELRQRRKKPSPPTPPPPFSSFSPGPETDSASFASDQFGSIFEEMLREEGLSADEAVHGGETSLIPRFWAVVGGLSGAALGFIIANFPGALAGAVAGNRLGAVRDARGRVFTRCFRRCRARIRRGY